MTLSSLSNRLMPPGQTGGQDCDGASCSQTPIRSLSAWSVVYKGPPQDRVDRSDPRHSASPITGQTRPEEVQQSLSLSPLSLTVYKPLTGVIFIDLPQVGLNSFRKMSDTRMCCHEDKELDDPQGALAQQANSNSVQGGKAAPQMDGLLSFP